jgi:pimeloyl-ACP methyl ester carboxylesterase
VDVTDVRSFDGTRLAVTTWGPEDGPTIVLVHGMSLSSEAWGSVPDSLAADGHRVVAYDLRGHAQSGDARAGGYTLDAHARDLDAVLAACLPEGGTAVVVGHSLGGGVMLAAARSAGHDRISRAVFVGSGGSAVTVPLLPRRLPPRMEAAVRTLWFRLIRAGVVLGRRLRSVEWLSDRAMRHFAFAEDAPDDVVARVRESFLSTRPLALAGTTFASVGQDGTEFAPGFPHPALVVHGTEDPEVPAEDLRRLLDALPDAELVSVPGAGHMLPLTHPEVVAREVARWTGRARAVTG